MTSILPGSSIVFHMRLPAVIGSALALLLVGMTPAFAQDYGGGAPQPEQAQPEQGEPRNTRRSRRPAPPTPAQNTAAAQAIITAAGADCTVTAASVPFETVDTKQPAYEAACSTGPGFIAIASSPPQALDCLELASSAFVALERDPATKVGQLCTLPQNDNALAVISTWAKEAGIDCTVDQGMLFGLTDSKGKLYEVGCAERDGYMIEKSAGAWKVSPCWDWAVQTQKCRFSTSAESLAAWKTTLAGTAAAACDATQARRVGRDAQGLTVYEVRCAAGDGYFARADATWKVQRVQTCVEAANVAGGCTLGGGSAAAVAPTTQQQ